MHNQFLESRLNQSSIQGGMKGQKIHNDIMTMLKKNLENAELALLQEKDHLKSDYAKVSLIYLKGANLLIVTSTDIEERVIDRKAR